MYGDAAISASGDDAILGLDIDEFHTYRFESLDGVDYTVSADGHLFVTDFASDSLRGAFLQMGGRGTCEGLSDIVNEWDFVRYGTIASGERIVASDPPGGFLDPEQYADLDRFIVTFDSTNYVYVHDVTVEVTGGAAPTVLQTRRRENTNPDTVEIVLGRTMPVGRTTTFTFDTGIASDCNADPPINCVKYTLIAAVCGDGVVAFPDEQCDDGPDNSDTSPDACRTDCILPRCGDSVTDSGEACDGSSDAACPGSCRFNCTCAVCGDGILDAGEECDGSDDAACQGECQTDCTCPTHGIPAVSPWGLAVLVLVLFALSSIIFRKPNRAG